MLSEHLVREVENFLGNVRCFKDLMSHLIHTHPQIGFFARLEEKAQ